MFTFRKVGSCVVVTAMAGVYLMTSPALGGTPFTSTWQTTNTSPGSSAADSVRLPLYDGGTYNFAVNWGDSSASTVTSWDDRDATHQYAASGSYTIQIAGTLNGWSFNNSGDRQKITDISDWGMLQLGNKGGAFQGATNLQISAAGSPDLTGVTNLSNTFAGATSFNNDVSGWNTSAVTDMSGMFMNATSFDQELNGWDTGQVTDMHSMFDGASDFSWYLVDWNTSNVTNMSRMFAGAESFTDDLDPWDVSGVTSMAGMFDGAASFDGEVAPWDVGQVTDMSRMFAGAESFNHSMGDWDTGNVTTMAGMFDGATEFAQDLAPLNTADVRDMSRMFAGATSFDQNLGAWNVRPVTTMTSMFTGSGISRDNYSETLIGWSAQPGLQQGVHLGASATYTCKAEDAHTILTRTFDWVITDGGIASCMEVPAAVQFPEAQVMATLGPIQTVTLRNTGYERLTLRSESLAEPARDFYIDQNECGDHVLLQGQECRITIRFMPQGAGRRTNALDIAYGNVLNVKRVALSGTGVRDGLGAQPTSMDFGTVTMGQTKDMTIWVTARIDGALSRQSLVISGRDRTSFSITDHTRCAGTLIHKDASCQFTVRYKPTSERTETAEILLGDGASVPLTGVGGPGALQPQTLDANPPKQIPLDGIVVITPPDTTTTAGQPILTTVTGGPLDQTIAAKKKYFRVIRGKHGKVSLRTYGYKHLRLVVKQKAKATPTYAKYVRKAVYVNGKRKSLKVRR